MHKPILIVGAGPTGLMMAAALARYEIPCRLIDLAPHPSTESKALAIQARTLEIFQDFGIVDSFLHKGQPVRAVNAFSQKVYLSRVEFKDLDSPYPFILSLEQKQTEEILSDCLRSFGLSVERGKELVSFRETEQGIEAHIRSCVTGQEEHVEASWLIGCDGAHSLVRKLLQMPFEGRALKAVFSLADVRLLWQYPHNEAYLYLQDTLAVIPMPGVERYRLIFCLPRCQTSPPAESKMRHGIVPSEEMLIPTLTEIQMLVSRCIGSDTCVIDPVWMSHFRINSRLIGSYRKGNVFLVGDAAHVHSPIGGQGMNTGLQDALNLAWKLALVHRKQASPILLDTYTAERRRVARRLLLATETASRLMTLRNRFAILLRDWIIARLARFKGFRKALARAVSQTASRYSQSVIVIESSSFSSGPRTGTRICDSLLTNTARNREPLHRLILFSGPYPSDESVQELIQLAHRIVSTAAYPIESLLVLLTPEIFSSLPIRCLSDASGYFHNRYGAKQSALYLIRPDLIVTFRSMPPSFPQ
ncbi:MAG: FAD-dependent monooxygenase [Chlamydiia bacterium]|nr:FAD-dependent monooxygenase [Chlamydiia bacterium]